MKTLNRFLCTLLVIITCITSIPLQGLVGAGIDYVDAFTASAALSDSGTCGANAKWKYDGSTKTLTIYGKGAMYDYDSYNSVEPTYCDRKKYPIKNVVIADGITRIGKDAFIYLDGYTDIETVKIAESVTSIGDSAFSGTKIKEVTLPKKLKRIEQGAFSGCSELKKVVVPDSVTVIERYAFDSCDALEELVIGNGVKQITDIFNCCEKLKKLTLGKNVKSIYVDFMNFGNSCAAISVHKDNKYYSSDKNGVLFNKKKTKLVIYPGNINLKSYTIPKTVTTIADFAFYDTDKLETVNTSNVKKIGDFAFTYSGVKEVVFGSKVETIGKYAFIECNDLKTIKVPASVIKIGEMAFGDKSEIAIDKNNKKYLSEDGVLFNKDKTTLIKYSKNNKADTYTIPATVTKISAYAFSDNDSLVNVNFPENLKTIGTEAFYDCDKIKTVTLSKNITTIGDYAFMDCNKLKKLVIAEGSTATIGTEAFSYSSQLSSISISGKIYKIGRGAFADTKYVSNMYSKNQQKAYYVGNVLCGVIGSPETVKIKEGTLGIADGAFCCVPVKTVTIPASLKYIGENVFEWTDALTKITVDKNNKHFIMENGVLFNKDKTRLIKFTSKSAKEYKVPDTVKYVDNYAFNSGAKLENIDLGSKVNKINITMFMGTKMYENMLKNSVIYYGKNAIEYIPLEEYNGLVIIKAGTKTISINEYTDSCVDAMYIPKSVTYIGNLPMDVYYEGSEEDWKKIKFGEFANYYMGSVNIHYNFKKDSKHTHKYYSSVILPEKCFTNVTIKYTCPCGHSYTSKGYVYDEHLCSELPVVEKAATLKSDGVKYDVCTSCKKKIKKITIAKVDIIKLSYTNTKYNGKVKTPDVIIIDSDGYSLIEDYHYTVKYSSGRKEVGTYYATVTFKGDYSGTKQLKFNIIAA